MELLARCPTTRDYVYLPSTWVDFDTKRGAWKRLESEGLDYKELENHSDQVLQLQAWTISSQWAGTCLHVQPTSLATEPRFTVKGHQLHQRGASRLLYFVEELNTTTEESDAVTTTTARQQARKGVTGQLQSRATTTWRSLSSSSRGSDYYKHESEGATTGGLRLMDATGQSLSV